MNEAEDIFIMTSSWNPKKDQQAYDRNYRTGQTKEVTVHILLIPYLPEHTPSRPSLAIDTWIMRRQQQKLQWAAQAAGRAFTGQEEIKGGAMGARDVAEMLGESGTGLAEYDLTRMIDASDREDDTSMADEDEMDTDED